MKKIKKRGAIYGVIALLLCVAVYLNWSYIDAPEDLLVAEQTDPEDAAASAQDAADGTDYFAASRLTREQARDEAVSTLKELSESEEADVYKRQCHDRRSRPLPAACTPRPRG